MTVLLDRWIVKVLCIAGLFVNQIVFILLPIKVSAYVKRKGEKGALVLSALSCFGGGVFFGAYLLQLQPEVRQMLDEVLLEPHGLNYPLPELIAGLGFFLILFVEQAVMWLQGRSYRRQIRRQQRQLSKDNLSKGRESLGVLGNHKEEKNLEILSIVERNSGDALIPCNCESHACNGDLNDGIKACGQGEACLTDNYQVTVCSGCGEHDAASAEPNGTTGAACNGHVQGDAVPNSDAEVEVEIDNRAMEAVSQAAVARSAIFIFALSLDSIFEGLSMGLKVTAQEVLTLFVAIVSHEFIMSFCIGMEMVRYYSLKKMIGVGFLYASTPVFGATIGTVIVETAGYGGNPAVDLANGILQAICAGAFMYCTFIGILGQEFGKDHGLLKALMAFLGFSFMAGMSAIAKDVPPSDLLVNTTVTPDGHML